MPTIDALYEQLTAEGSPFALAPEDVLGIPMPVFSGRAHSLRELLERSTAHDEQDYLVSGETRLTYRDHRARVASLARAMADKYGVSKGDRVAIFAANGPEWIVAFWAVTSLGGIVVAMNGWWAPDEIAHAVEDSKPMLIVGDHKRLSRLPDAARALPIVEFETELDALVSESAPLPKTPIDEDDPACILYTSGTTGRAKGAMLSHRSLIAGAMLQTLNGAATRLASGGPLPTSPPCMLLTTPLFHVSGLVAGVITMLSVGARVVLRQGRFDPAEVMRLIQDEQVSTWTAMPTMAHRVLNHADFERFDLSSLVSMGSGGSALGPDLQARIRERLPQTGLGTGYGLTESGGVATINSGADLASHPGSAGRAMPSVEVEIRDPEGRVLGEGHEGEIFLRSPLLMLGYWRNDEATKETLDADRWLATGDIGRLEDGRLFINSRARDLILRGSENIYPTEVEHAIEGHPAIEEAAVLGVDHEELGQEVLAHVVAREGETIHPPVIAEWLRDRIAAFKIPAHWVVRSEPLPRNASGKVVKPALENASRAPVEDDA